MAETATLDVGDGEINLTQVLKLANLAESGGQAKLMIGDGLVRVNGEVETRKRRKMAVGDVVEVEGLPAVVLRRSAT
jgi:ribosome-associated protein